MAASSITCCASWPRKPMAFARNTLAGLSLALILAACSGNADRSDSRESDTGKSAPPPTFIPQLAAAESAGDTKPFRKFLAPDLDFGDGDTLASQVLNASPQDVQDFIDANHVRLIDVRTPEEFARGHLDGAELIPMDSFDPEAIVLSDDQTIILYCRSGRRSRIVGEKLAAHTGKPAIHLEGGILAWEAAGKPVTAP